MSTGHRRSSSRRRETSSTRCKRLGPAAGSHSLPQLVKLVEQFLLSDRLRITPPLFYQDETARRLLITLNMSKVVQHVGDAVNFENTERLEPVFDRATPSARPPTCRRGTRASRATSRIAAT